MKKILSLIATLTSVPIFGTITIGCNTTSQIKLLDTTISKALSLTDDNNLGTVSAQAVNNGNNQAVWMLDYSKLNISASYLLNSENKEGYATAKSEHIYKFLLDTLKIEPVSGNYFTDALFDVNIAKEITVKVVPNSIKVSVKLTENKMDFFIANGSYQIQFVRGDDVLTIPYAIKLKVDNEDISDGLITQFLQTKLEFYQYKIFGFKIGYSDVNPQIGENITDSLEYFKSFFKLIHQGSVKITITSKTCATGIWQAGDKITIEIAINNIIKKFNYDLTVWKNSLENITQETFNMKLNDRFFSNKNYDSLTFSDFNKYSLIFLENNLGPEISFKYSDNPHHWDDIGHNQIKLNDIVYVQISVNNYNQDPCWTGTSHWLKIKIVNQ